MNTTQWRAIGDARALQLAFYDRKNGSLDKYPAEFREETRILLGFLWPDGAMSCAVGYFNMKIGYFCPVDGYPMGKEWPTHWMPLPPPPPTAKEANVIELHDQRRS